MGDCGKPKHLCNCKKTVKKSQAKRLRYVGNPVKGSASHYGSEYARKRDGLEKKPKPSQPIGLRFK